MAENRQPLFRMIVPAYPRENIFTQVVTELTALGPILIATIVCKLGGWRVEVIDENNFTGPRGKDGLPDHAVLQKDDPAAVVGLYCGLTCTIERVWTVAAFYKSQGITTIAGGWHAKDRPKETLAHNIDVVFYGGEEEAVKKFFNDLVSGRPYLDTPGIYFLKDNVVIKNFREKREIVRGYDKSLDEQPYPDYSLLRHAHELKIYTIRRIVGCSEHCEYCRVKGIPCWASPLHLFQTVQWLVGRFGAYRFFIADDNSGEDREGGLEFFRMIKQEYGNRLNFGVQVRADAAKDTELTNAMHEAGVVNLYIGFESPIDEDLQAMNKGLSCADMLKCVKILRRKFRYIHGMFVMNYPREDIENTFSAREIIVRFKRFIRKAKLDSIQTLLPIPLLKTGLRTRLEKEGRVLPLEVAPWNAYDGTLAVIVPDGNISLEEFQEIPLEIMKWFYSRSYARIIWRICTSPIDFFKGWKRLRRGWIREGVRYFGANIVKKWHQRKEKEPLIQRIKDYLKRQKLS